MASCNRFAPCFKENCSNYCQGKTVRAPKNDAKQSPTGIYLFFFFKVGFFLSFPTSRRLFCGAFLMYSSNTKKTTIEFAFNAHVPNFIKVPKQKKAKTKY